MSPTTSFDKLYLEFPQVPAEGDDPNFKLIGVFFTTNEGDAYEFAAWASTLGSTADTDTAEATKADGTKTTITLPRDNLDNEWVSFSFWRGSVTSFGNFSNAPEWLRNDGTSKYG